MKTPLIIALGAFVLSGCIQTTDMVKLPLAERTMQIQSAMQQEVISLAIDAEVARLKFDDWAKRSAYVEVCGVFPPGENELLDYIKMSVEGRLLQAGVIIREKTDMLVEKKVDGDAVKEIFRATPDTDLRIVICVAQCGADQKKKGFIECGYYIGKCRLKVIASPRKEGITLTKHIVENNIGKASAVVFEMGKDYYLGYYSRAYDPPPTTTTTGSMFMAR
ncbi:MAG: hypothetical protein ACYS8W_00835 [Planctomycetota bacterium]|jgi:hypothetical protein